MPEAQTPYPLISLIYKNPYFQMLPRSKGEKYISQKEFPKGVQPTGSRFFVLVTAKVVNSAPPTESTAVQRTPLP